MNARNLLRRAAAPAAVFAALWLAACGNSTPLGGTGIVQAPRTEELPASAFTPEARAARFLAQATFGPRMSEIRALSGKDFGAWIDQQVALAPTFQYDGPREGGLFGPAPYTHDERIDDWWRASVRAPDQLRQRVAFAWSEIMVVSDRDDILGQNPDAVGYYTNVLIRHALGNYRELLEAVTLSPAMGQYLSMLQNQRPDAEAGIRADENYARECMQLFSVGLVMLNPDGTRTLDGNGKPIPTYTQAEIEGLARVFTGWSWDTPSFFTGAPNWTAPMAPFEDYHDRGEKTIVTGAVIPAGQTTRQDLEQALDVLFNHPNVGPFIGRQLIQRLVTSNPSPEYVARVAAVFADNGAGVRGDLAAVVKAILLDPEARELPEDLDGYGKLREPLLRVTHLWRAFNGNSSDGSFGWPHPQNLLEQAPFRSPSVFNFFRPDYRPTGPLAAAGLAAPEFQITTESSIVEQANALFDRSVSANRGSGPAQAQATISTAEFHGRAGNADALLDDLGLLLLSGQMTATTRAVLREHVEALPADAPSQRVAEAAYLIYSSPQYTLQR